ncbi:hypothetical protein [Infirmifilum uzonense]|uniref:hypothetical protein n=1 Tax=Infirmifilum uzonense TaxID=1550241 RepID=UPI000A607F34|nr:hypothetical protein [Infirmifilum uzonense]
MKRPSQQELALVVDLIEDECCYDLPEGRRRISFPIQDFSFTPPANTHIDVIEAYRIGLITGMTH